MDIRVCEAFWAVSFSKNAQTFWFFDIVGGMCSVRWQSFKTQLNHLPAKIFLSGIFWSFSWHMKIWTLRISEKWKYVLSGIWPTISTQFTHTNRGITVMRVVGVIKHLYIHFFYTPSPLECFVIWIHVNFKEHQEQWVWQEGHWVGSWNFGILKKHTFLPQYQKIKMFERFWKK